MDSIHRPVARRRDGVGPLFRVLTRTSLILALTCAAGRLSAQDWPQWRGPARDGVTVGVEPPQRWPEKLARRWQVEVGLGHSSPIVLGDRVYIFSRQGDDERLSCRRLVDGGEVWAERYPAPYEVISVAAGHGKGPKSTPVAADGRVFTLGISGILSAFDVKGGKRLWQHTFQGEFAATAPLYGAAMSPLVLGKTCVAHVGGHEQGLLAGFDVATGRRTWSASKDGPAYGSPIVVQAGSKPQLVTQTQLACVILDGNSGKELARQDFTTEYDQNSVTPLATPETIVFGGYNQPSFAVKRGPDAKKSLSRAAWENAELPMFMSSPVFAGGRVIGFTQRNAGQLFAIDATSGKLQWRGDPRQGENAALVVVGRYLLSLTNEAQLSVYDLGGREPKFVATYEVAESPTWAHAVPIRGGVLVKDMETLALWKWE